MRPGAAWQERCEFGSQTQLTRVHDNSLVACNDRRRDDAANDARPGETAPDEMSDHATLDASVLGCIV